MRHGPQPRVLVAGAGELGVALCTRLSSTGHNVWGLRRNVGKLPVSVHRIEADLVVPNTLRHLPEVDFAFYLAGPADSTDGSARAVYVDGLRYFLSALAQARRKPERVFIGSSLAVYGPRMHDCLDEDSAPMPEEVLGRRAAEGEQIAVESGLPVTILRFGLMYGHGRRLLVDEVASGRVPALPPEAMLNLVHQDDAVGAMHHLLSRRRHHDAYLVIDGEPVEGGRLVAWLADRMQVPMPTMAGDLSLPQTTFAHCIGDRLRGTGHRPVFGGYQKGFSPLLSSRLVRPSAR